MEPKRALWLSGVLGSVVVLAALGPWAPRIIGGGAGDALEKVWVAPDPLPPGATTLLVGSIKPMAASLSLSSRSEGLAVEKVERVGRSALVVALSVPSTAGQVEVLLESSAEQKVVALRVGEPQAPLVEPCGGVPEEALSKGALETSSPWFIYSFLPKDGVDLARVCILNQADGVWHERNLASPPPEEPSPAGAEEAVEPPRPDFIGVGLEPGENKLLIATFDREGDSRLEEFRVTYVPPGAGEGS